MPTERSVQPHPASRRGATRRKLDLDVASETGTGAPAPVTVLNLSATGALLRTAEPLRIGERLRLALPNGPITGAKVVWASDELYGCRFDKPISRGLASAAALKSRFEPAQASPADAPETFGARVKRLRKAKGLTMVGLGERVGVSKPTVWKWETDAVRPRHPALERLAEVLEVSEIGLLYGNTRSSATEPAPQRAETTTLREALDDARSLMAALTGLATEQIELTVSIRA